MKRIATSIFFTMLLVGLAGCATILNEETQKVNIVSSNGKPFKGTVDGIPFEGPGIVELRRAKEDKVIVVDTEGCTKQTIATRRVSNVFWVNIILGGAFGSTTDYATDEMWGYDDNIEVSCSG